MGQHATPISKEISKEILIHPTAIYSQTYILREFGMAKATLKKWHDRGLRQLDLKTLQSWYLGSEILRFMQCVGMAGDPID